MMGFDSLLGSHYDRYYLDYTDYSELKTIDPAVFDMTKGEREYIQELFLKKIQIPWYLNF